MKIDEREVPTPVLAHWKQALDDASPAALKTLASVHPSLQSGFRPGKVPPAQLRTRAKAMLDTSGGLPEALRHLLVQQGLQRELVCVLSEAAIEAHAASWADAVGRSAFFSAMLLDDRAAVRSVGFSQAEGWDGQGADELEAARACQNLIEEFGPFLRCVAPLVHRLPDASAPSGPGDDDDLASPGANRPSASHTSTDLSVMEHLPKTDATVLSARPPRPAQERDLVLQLRAQRQEARRAQRACDEAQRERDRLAARLETTDTHLTEARAELRRLKDELRNTQARIDELVRESVQAQLDARLRPWLAPAEALERAVHDLGEDTPAAQAEALLRRQAEVDRREGLRSALVAELHRTQAALAEVQRAQVDALNPLPQLPEMARRLQAHEAILRARLDDATSHSGARVSPQVKPMSVNDMSTSGPLERLHQVLAAAPTLDALAQIRRQVQAAEPLGLLSADEAGRAHALMHEAAARLYDRSLVGLGVAQVPSLDARAFPLQALQRDLVDGRHCVMIVDGHNVLHLLPTIFRPHYDQRDQPTASARKALADRLLHLASRMPTLQVELWFDGPAQDTRTLSDRVRLHFSGGSGSDRADRSIVAQVRHLMAPGLDVRPAGSDGSVAARQVISGSGATRGVFVVTADGDVRHEAHALGASVLLPVELGFLLE